MSPPRRVIQSWHDRFVHKPAAAFVVVPGIAWEIDRRNRRLSLEPKE